MRQRQERKYRRFELKCPVILRYSEAHTPAEIEVVSQNVSIGGLLVKSASVIPEHTPVNFIISVQADGAVQPIYLTGEGQIVRVTKTQDNGMSTLAVECQAPITGMEGYLPLT